MIQILGLLCMYFDAVVVEVEKYLLFFQIGSGHTVIPQTSFLPWTFITVSYSETALIFYPFTYKVKVWPEPI